MYLLLEPQQNNLSNLDPNLEHCQVWKMKCFEKIANG